MPGRALQLSECCDIYIRHTRGCGRKLAKDVGRSREKMTQEAWSSGLSALSRKRGALAIEKNAGGYGSHTSQHRDCDPSSLCG